MPKSDLPWLRSPGATGPSGHRCQEMPALPESPYARMDYSMPSSVRTHIDIAGGRRRCRLDLSSSSRRSPAARGCSGQGSGRGGTGTVARCARRESAVHCRREGCPRTRPPGLRPGTPGPRRTTDILTGCARRHHATSVPGNGGRATSAGAGIARPQIRSARRRPKPGYRSTCSRRLVHRRGGPDVVAAAHAGPPSPWSSAGGRSRSGGVRPCWNSSWS